MLITLAALILVQGTTQQPPRPDSTARRARSVTIGIRSTSRDSILLTAELEANAYRDPASRALIARARVARTTHDSALQSYRATSYQRISLGTRLRSLGRERLAMRAETASEIEWQRGVGARVHIQGSRLAAPIVSSEISPHWEPTIGSASSIPYFPGRESLWPIGEFVSDSGWTIWRHPLRPRAEAYYRYATGDSIRFTLPDGSRIQLTEIRVEPREPRADLVAGSFWFDASSAHLVRAHYRPSIPMELRSAVATDGKGWPLGLRPLRLVVTSVVVEFALHEGRWWLPSRQAANGEGQVTFVRLPLTVEERFSYSTVNGLAPMAPIAEPAPDDSSAVDSALAASPGRRRLPTGAARCIRTGGRTVQRRDSILVEVRLPCDSAALVSSPSLPPSIFEADDAPVSSAERDLLARALGMDAQASFAPGRPSFQLGLDLMRYNRVEGLSVGGLVSQQLGAGLSAELVGRVGTADLRPRGELTVERRDAFRTIAIGGYERLAVANDWGSPLDFGASLGALLFGRDEGLYYRVTGAELIGRGAEDPRFLWRVFAERHRDANVETHGSLAHAISGNRFRENIDAAPGDVLGAGLRLSGALGENPGRPRAFGELRVEGATGDFEYARAMLDATLSVPLGRTLATAITIAGGTSAGELPPQRLWYLGGTHTVRGQPIGAARGDAFWMGRGELGFGVTGIRTSVFADLGWAGERTAWRSPGRPISGAGVGLSFLDGMVRFDLARGVHPTRGWRGALFLDARF